MISVIVPVYNVGEYLDQCLTSICSQTYADLEVIIVNDGSTDRSGEICEKWAKSDERIILIHQENRGLSAARNTGLERASGEYVAFVDSDDYLPPDAYEKLIKAMLSYQCDIVFGNTYRVEDDQTREMHLFNEQSRTLQGFDFWNIVYDEEITFDNPVASVVWSKLYKKEIWENLRFPEGEIREDEAVLLDVFKACSKMVYINEPVYCYRIRKNSIIHSVQAIKKELFYLKVSRERVQFFLEQGELDCVKKASSKAKHSYFELYLKAEDKKQFFDLVADEYHEMVQLERRVRRTVSLSSKENLLSRMFCISLKGYILLKK